MGDEAVALGAINAGITGVYALSGDTFHRDYQYIQGSETAREAGIHCTWCTNEKTAMRRPWVSLMWDSVRLYV